MTEPSVQSGHPVPTVAGPFPAPHAYPPVPPPVAPVDPAVLQPWDPGHPAPVPLFPAGPVPYGAPFAGQHPVDAPATRRRLVPALAGALVLALVGAAVAVTLLLTGDGEGTPVASAGTGSPSVAADTGGASSGGASSGGSSSGGFSSGGASSGGSPSSIYNSDEREFMRDFRDFSSARAGSTDDFALVDLGYQTCSFVGSAGGSDAALVAAVGIGVDAGWSEDDATALVAASVVNLCPEYG